MPKKENELKRTKKTQKEIEKDAKKNGSIRVGVTDDPKRRAREYEQEGYQGTMEIARTSNMRKAENRLLDRNYRHNQQKESNAPEKEGYIYLIRGRKLSQKK
jgi:hypothetical protein